MGKKNKNRRKSYITVLLVVLLIVLIAIFCIKTVEDKEKKPSNKNNKEYYSNLLEEDMMQYEYSKINEELNGLCAFATVDDNVVGLNENGEIVKIYEINPNNTYDYIYYLQRLYLLEKETGIISIIPLKTEVEGEYIVEDTINIGSPIDEIQVYNNEIYYLQNKTLYKYLGVETYEMIYENISNNSFVIKNNFLYIITDSKLLKVSLDTKEEEIIAYNVKAINYYNYYERDKLVFETSLDGENSFKNIYYYYNGNVINSIKNNGYFIPYDSNQYVYISNDNNKLMLIDRNGNNKILYTSPTGIEKAIFIKDGHIIVEEKEQNIFIDIINKNEDRNYSEKIDNIKYIK